MEIGKMTRAVIGFVVGALLAIDAGPIWAAPIKVRFAVPMPTIGTLPLWIAKERGFFAKEGLEVEVIAVAGGLDITSLISGSVEFTDSVPANAIVAAHKGTDLKIIAGTLNAITYSVMGRKGLAGLKDLKEKKIGVGGIFSGSTLVLHEMLATHCLSYPGDYTLIRVGGASDRLVALLSGQVDAVTLPIPFSLIAADQGTVNLADAADYVRHYQNTALITRTKWAQGNGDATVRVLRGMLGAIRWIYGNREEFVDYATKKLKMKKEYAAAGWDTYAGKKIWSYDGSPTREGMETVIRHQVRLGLLPEGTKAEKYIDLSYLQRTRKE